MNRQAALALFLMAVFSATAQLRNKNWYFGDGAGVRFDTGGPVALTTNLPSIQTASAMSDPQGNFLFLMTNPSVYDASLSSMPNGVGPWFPAGAQYQAIAIYPRATDPDLFDVVYRVAVPGPYTRCRLRYLLVDMALNGGSGDVFGSAMTVWGDSLIMSFAGATNTNGTDYWFLTHEINTDRFLAYAVGTAGLDTVPVPSSVGPVHFSASQFSGDLQLASTQWAFNLQGDRLLTTGTYRSSGILIDSIPGLVELYAFDQATGQVAPLLSIPGFRRPSDCEWSPSGDFIYLTDFDSLNTEHLFQFDLSSGDSSIIVASKTSLGTWQASGGTHQMQQGPDGRIYISRSGGPLGQSYLSCITAPDQPGLSSGYVENFLSFYPEPWPGILPTMLKRYHDSDFPLADHMAQQAYNEQLAVWPNPANGQAFVKLPLSSGVDRLRILDAAGRLSMEVVPSEFTIQPLDLSGLAPGAYVLSALAAQQLVGSARFVVE